MQSGRTVPEPIMNEVLWGLKRMISSGLITAEEILYLYLFVTGRSYSEISVRTLRLVQEKISKVLFRLQFLVGGCLYDDFLSYILSDGDPEIYQKSLKGIFSMRKKLARRKVHDTQRTGAQVYS